jgi:RimJ/RimL family protein N-acetyltransferase
MIEFVEYDEEFLNYSWIWLNDIEIKTLISASDFSKEEQLKWFLDLPNKKNYYIKGVLIDGEKIGVVGLKNISSEDGEYWGYIGDKKFWGKGIGKRMTSFIIEVGNSQKLKRIYLTVLDSNTRAIALYKSMGFKTIHNKMSVGEIYMEYELNSINR